MAGHTAACFSASSHWTMTSACPSPRRGSRRRLLRISPEPAKGRFETTEKGSRGQLQRLASASTTRTPRGANRRRSSAASRGSSSTATTSAPASSSARVNTPVPAPTSTTRSPGAIRASLTISAASRLLRRKCWPGAPGVRVAAERPRKTTIVVTRSDSSQPCGLCHSRAVFDHVTIRVSNREASERFYDTVLAALGIEKTYSDAHFAEWNDFSLAEHERRAPAHETSPHRLRGADARRRRPLLGSRDGSRISRRRPSRAPAAVHRGLLRRLPARPGRKQRRGGPLRVGAGARDRPLWIRGGRRAGVEAVLRGAWRGAARLRASDGQARAVRFAGEDRGGSFSLVAGDTPTEHVHLAFPVADDASVDASIAS